jgi:hypothetical protein
MRSNLTRLTKGTVSSYAGPLALMDLNKMADNGVAPFHRNERCRLIRISVVG